MTIEEAETHLLSVRPPGTRVIGGMFYEGMYLFLAPSPDPLEGFLLPFFSVNPETEEVRDFSPQDYDDPMAILSVLNQPT
mgnify:CR=1 FL=1